MPASMIRDSRGTCAPSRAQKRQELDLQYDPRLLGPGWLAGLPGAIAGGVRGPASPPGPPSIQPHPPFRLPDANMTLAEAERRCGAAAACFGFEFNSFDRAPPSGAVLRVTFRRRARFNPDRGNTVTQHNPAPVAVDGRARGCAA